MPLLPPRRIAHAQELLDADTIDSDELRSSLEHVEQVNRCLGGERSLLRHIRPHLRTGARIVDIGTGNAAIPRRIATEASRLGASVEIVAVDSNPAMLAIARSRTRDTTNVILQQADALALPFRSGAFDVACMTLTLHHFEDDAPVTALREMARVANVVLVSDLERCWPNYLGSLVLARTVWRHNRITRHDGPLSVLRAFTSDELRSFAAAAGLRNVRVHRHFFHRLLLQAHR